MADTADQPLQRFLGTAYRLIKDAPRLQIVAERWSGSDKRAIGATLLAPP